MADAAPSPKVVDFARVSLARLLFASLRQRLTGTLEVLQPNPHPGPRCIWLVKGMPVYTNWVSPSAVLGQLLVAKNLIQPATLDAALKHMSRDPGALLGQQLLASGHLDQSTLDDILRYQCGRKTLEVFALQSGTATVSTGSHPYGQMRPVNALEVIMAGISRHYDEARILREFGSARSERLTATPSLARYQQHFRFRADDQPILEQLKRGSTLDQLQTTGAAPLRALQVALALWVCQMLHHEAAPQRKAPSPKTPSAPPQPDRAAFIHQLEELEGLIAREAHAFALFGLSGNASRNDIRQAWANLSKAMHPDALIARGWLDVRDRVRQVFAALSEAYSVLSDKSQRQQLADMLARGEDPNAARDASAQLEAALRAESITRDADRLNRAGRFDQALAHYQRALELTPHAPNLKVAITWCRYAQSEKHPSDAQAAEQALAVLVANAPKLAQAHYYRGLILRDLHDLDGALAALAQATQHDPNHIDAQRQARAIRATRQAGATSASPNRGLRGLLKR